MLSVGSFVSCRRLTIVTLFPGIAEIYTGQILLRQWNTKTARRNLMRSGTHKQYSDRELSSYYLQSLSTNLAAAGGALKCQCQQCYAFAVRRIVEKRQNQ